MRKFLYSAGPGNVVGTYKFWLKGQDDPSQQAMTFSGQFYDLCSSLDAKGYIISSNSDKKILKDKQFVLEHRPIPFLNRSSLLYYIGQMIYELSIVITALRYRADVVITGETECFFVLLILPVIGIQVVPSLHGALWPKYIPPSKFQRLLRKILGMSHILIVPTKIDFEEGLNQVVVEGVLAIVLLLLHQFALQYHMCERQL